MSKTLIVYASKHGCAESCARTLAEKIDGETVIQNLKNKKTLELESFDQIIIGGSVYAGRVQKEVRIFCRDHEEILKRKTLGLFLCGTSEGDAANRQLETAYPASLLLMAAAKESFGGRIILDQMNFFEKRIIKAVAKLESDMSNLSLEAIDRFANALKSA